MGIGLAGLVSGFQQGFGFADEMRSRKEERERRAKDDEFREETRGRQKKAWGKEDAYEAEVRAETEKFFPSNKPSTTPASTLGAGVQPVEQPDSQTRRQSPVPLDPELQGAPVAGTTPQASAKVAAIGTGAPAPDQFTNANATFDYLLRRAQIDLKHGKMDGVGLLTLQKTVEGMRAENMDKAISLMHQGRDAEAIAAFNSSGEHKGRVVGVQDGVFDAGGVQVPTRIVTIETGNGERRVINTAQTLNQRQAMDRLIAQAQGGAQLKLSQDNAAEQRRHNGVVEADNRQSHAEARADRAERRADKDKNPYLERIEQEEAARGEKYDAPTRKARLNTLMGLDKDFKAERTALEKRADKAEAAVLNNGGTAAEALTARNDFIRTADDMDTRNAVSEHIGGKQPGTPEYAQAYQRALQAKGVTPEVLAAWNFPPPSQQVANPVQPPAGQGAQRAAAGTLRPNDPALRTKFDKNYQPAAAPSPYQLEQQREAQAEQAEQAKRRAQDIGVLQRRIAMLEKDASTPRNRAQLAADRKRLATLQAG